VTNWYIAEKLGWADCRLWHVESVEKYLVVLWLALAYLEVRKANTYAGVTWLKSSAYIARSMPGPCSKKRVTSRCEPVTWSESLPDTHWLLPEPG
jgi:hypothetical protein